MAAVDLRLSACGAAGKPLPDWHYLISGSRETVHRGRPVDARLDGQRGRCRRTGISSCRPAALKPFRPSRPAAADRDPPHPRRPVAAPALDEARAAADADLPAAHQPARRAALGAANSATGSRPSLPRLPPAEPFVPGAIIPFEGREIRLDWDRRRCRDGRALDGDVLGCGGPDRRHLRGGSNASCAAGPATCCRDETAEMRAIAGRDGRRRVASATPTRRWGSCSASGAHPLQLAADPRPARSLLRWVVAHEVAHRRHMNHGPAFKALEAELFDGDVAAARSIAARARAAAQAGRPGSDCCGGGGGPRARRLLRFSDCGASTSSSHCWSTWRRFAVAAWTRLPADRPGGRRRSDCRRHRPAAPNLPSLQAPGFLVGLELPVGQRHLRSRTARPGAWPPRRS